MKCKQFRDNLPDWLTNRLASRDHAAMAAHSATCPACAGHEREERRLRAAWQDLPTRPAPDILPRLASRLNVTRPAPAPRWNAFLTIAGTACALAAAAWLTLPGIGYEPPSYEAERVAASCPVDSPPLEDMLDGVRWRSSDEWDAQEERPVYDTQVRSLLLVRETN